MSCPTGIPGLRRAEKRPGAVVIEHAWGDIIELIYMFRNVALLLIEVHDSMMDGSLNRLHWCISPR